MLRSHKLSGGCCGMAHRITSGMSSGWTWMHVLIHWYVHFCQGRLVSLSLSLAPTLSSSHSLSRSHSLSLSLHCVQALLDYYKEEFMIVQFEKISSVPACVVRSVQ